MAEPARNRRRISSAVAALGPDGTLTRMLASRRSGAWCGDRSLPARDAIDVCLNPTRIGLCVPVRLPGADFGGRSRHRHLAQLAGVGAHSPRKFRYNRSFSGSGSRRGPPLPPRPPWLIRPIEVRWRESRGRRRSVRQLTSGESVLRAPVFNAEDSEVTEGSVPGNRADWRMLVQS